MEPNHNLYIYFIPVLSFVIGSVPFGLLFGKMKGIDPREHGSRNIGATNVARTLGKSYGVLTLILDMFKGFLPVFAVSALFSDNTMVIALSGLFAVVGHCFSLFLSFKGGKGVATGLGVALAVCPVSFLISIAVFLLVFRIWGYVSVGSLSAMLSFPISVYFLCPDPFLESMAWTICFIIWLKHSDNLKRLASGTEKRFKAKEG